MHPTDVERREQSDRRSGADRRTAASERRPGDDRRKSDRRLGVERRLALQSAADQIRASLGLLTRAVDTGRLDDDARRFLDAAVLRLAFALDRLDQP